nr:hypothetical protein [Candidatus Sigynarchaeota archaeon]
MKRFASIDFLRGTAIVIMILLHTLSWFLDFGAILADPNRMALINLVALVVFEYLGGLAGFFLLVSAIGNMISMYKRLQAGKSVDDLVLRQVVGGIILIVFAYLVEGTIGYLGAFGDLMLNLNHPASPDYLRDIFSRSFHFETIHTIAWCVLINGIVQGILSRNGAWKNVKKQIIAYAVMAVIVVAITQPVWMLAQMYGGTNGFPWNMATGAEIQRPYLLDPNTTFLDVLKGVFLTALAGPMEPLTPYLSISFVGSIIGIIMAQPREKIPRSFPRKMMYVGMAMFVVGTIGVILFMITIIQGPYGLDRAIQMYEWFSYHRHWYNNPGNPLSADPLRTTYPETFTFPLAWLWQFLSLNGTAILITMFVIRMVEFRGYGAGFAKKTTFVRRFGFIAFTNYNNQWYLWIIRYVAGMIIIATGLQALAWPSYSGDNTNPYQGMTWGVGLLLVVIIFSAYHGIMLLWERVKYTGTLEWAIGTIAGNLIPSRKSEAGEVQRKRWYQKGQLDVQGGFYNAEWLNVIEEKEIPHASLADSKLAHKLAWACLVSLLFMPACLVTWRLALSAEKTEGKNKYNRRAKIVSIIGICIVLGVLIPLFFLTASDLGFSF